MLTDCFAMHGDGVVIFVESDPDIIEAARAHWARAGIRSVMVVDEPAVALRLARDNQTIYVLFGPHRLRMLGGRVSAQFRAFHGAVRVILVLRDTDLGLPLGRLDLCDGFLFLDHHADCLPDVLALAESGYCVLPSPLVDRLASSQTRLESLRKLSHREMRVLVLLGCGLSNRAIAERLRCRETSAKNGVRSVLKKMRFRNRTQAGVFACRYGLAAAPDHRLRQEL